MKTFDDLEKGSKYALKDVSHMYPDYCMPVGMNDSAAIVAYFRNGEVVYTDKYSPVINLWSDE